MTVIRCNVEPMMSRFSSYICVTRPHRVNLLGVYTYISIGFLLRFRNYPALQNRFIKSKHSHLVQIEIVLNRYLLNWFGTSRHIGHRGSYYKRQESGTQNRLRWSEEEQFENISLSLPLARWSPSLRPSLPHTRSTCLHVPNVPVGT